MFHFSVCILQPLDIFEANTFFSSLRYTFFVMFSFGHTPKHKVLPDHSCAMVHWGDVSLTPHGPSMLTVSLTKHPEVKQVSKTCHNSSLLNAFTTHLWVILVTFYVCFQSSFSFSFFFLSLSSFYFTSFLETRLIVAGSIVSGV